MDGLVEPQGVYSTIVTVTILQYNNKSRLAKICVELDWVLIFSGFGTRSFPFTSHLKSFDLISKMELNGTLN